MRLGISGEILLVSYRLAHERLLHHDGVEQEVAQEHTEGEDYGSSIRRCIRSGELGGIGNCVDITHSSHYEGGEEGHKETCADSQDDSLLLVGFADA